MAARQDRHRAEQALKIQLDRHEMANAYAQLHKALAQLQILDKVRHEVRRERGREHPAPVARGRPPEG